MVRISVVIPLFNEEDNVLPLLEELVPVAGGLDPECEVLLVDDGSVDRTSERIFDAQRRWPRHVRHLSLGRNCGQTAALDAGFRNAGGELVVTMDGDLQVDPRDIPMMVENAGEYDVVHGWRWQRRDSWWKRVQAGVANLVRNRLTRSKIRDAGCPLKVFRRDVLQGMKLHTGFHRFLVNMAQLDGYRTLEVKVNHRPRIAGSSKYGVWNRAFRALRDLLVFRWMVSRNCRYELTEHRVPSSSPGSG